MIALRKLVAGAAVAFSVAVTAIVTTTTPSPTPGGSPIVTVTTKPTTAPTTRPVYVFDRPARYIVGHHQGGPAWTVPIQARRWFVDVQGYADVAYNAMITPAGAVWQGRGEQYASAANYGLNNDAVAFCWLGDLNRHPPTDAQLVAAAAWVKGARTRHPGAVLIGHKDVAKIARNGATTECPGAAAVRANSLRAVWLMVCGYPLAEAKARAAAGR